MVLQVFGRLPVCDISLEHPSLSRYHAVLQYRPTDAPTVTAEEDGAESSPLSSSGTDKAGFYVYDLNSTHGSFLNKKKLQPRVYYRMRVGQMIRFGGSTRLFVLEVRQHWLYNYIQCHMSCYTDTGIQCSMYMHDYYYA